MNNCIEVPASEVVKDMTCTVTVTGWRAWSVRWWVVLKLLTIASWIAPVGRFDVVVDRA